MRFQQVLRLESLEKRDLLTQTIHIDAKWVEQAAGKPIVLNQTDTLYILDVDVKVPGTAFVIAAPDITLDLNGHTVTYGDINPIQVYNDGFELGSGSSLPGWNLSGAPKASKVPAMTGMWGQWMLQMTSFNTKQTILSDPIAVPLANHEYAAIITPKGPYGTTVKISVVDAVSGTVLGSGTSANTDRGFSAVALFTPTTTNAVRLRVEVTPPSGQTVTVSLDYASLVPSRDYGVMATQVWSGQLPLHLQTPEILASYRTAADFILKNGALIQGRGKGRASSPIYLEALPNGAVNSVYTYVTGVDTHNLNANWAISAFVTKSVFEGDVDRVTNRMDIVAAIYMNNFAGTAVVSNCSIGGVPHVGILVAGTTELRRVSILGNGIRQDAMATDGYGILFAGVRHFDVAWNTIIPENGRGILIDGWGRIPTENGTIRNNYVEIHERPNLEYGDKLEATALRIRNYESTFRNLLITQNTFYAWTAPGLVYAAQGTRVSHMNGNGQLNAANNRIIGNYFKAIVKTTNTYYIARAVSVSEVGAGTGLIIADNWMECNDCSLAFGDTDSWNGAARDIWMGGNVLRRTTEGATRTFTTILAGAYQTTVDDIAMPATYLDNGAQPKVVYGGGNVTNLRIEWQHYPPGGDGFPGFDSEWDLIGV